ncbi:hypothetical protein FC093_17060 [Ilyomonas limi]|uniref:DUF2231 domain-containing protein n=1 Tax=Ilyomonas limi TaxID=2575867 RepID=A0A4U3KX93_9BACT|nr:DUF2231 domain-containing protein [Ilyomonas limi]TKK66294.1 hypothetical protein FC093_17060 [Ilyomonas limi]
MFKDYPSLHPLAIHFPIVLLLLAVPFQAIVIWKPNWVQIRWTALFIMAGGFFSAWAASTLFHAMISPDAPKSALILFKAHEKYAQYTLWMAGGTLLLKGIGDFYKINRRSFDVIVLIAAIISAIFLSVAGHHGARLTHVEGVGPMGKYLGTEEDEKNMENGTMDMGNMKMDSAKKMSDSMPGMNNMPSMDTMKGMDSSMDMNGMDNMDNMKNMPGMGKKDNKNNMKDMKGIKDMKGMDNMKDMPGMDKSDKNKMKDMKGMDNMKDMDNMKNMPGMDTSGKKNSMNDMKGMNNMKDMPGMDSSMNMKDMGNMKGMKSMKLIDSSKPYDNNPARERTDSAKRDK